MAAIASTVHSAMILNSIHLGFGRHLWDIRAIILIKPMNVRLLECTSLIYPFAIWFIKYSILLLYLRLFGVYKSVRIACYAGIAFLTAFYLSYLGVQIGFLLECITPNALITNKLCKNLYALTVFQSAVNVATDFYVFLIPIPRILDLNVARSKKFGLLIVFLAGFLACLVSIARLIFTTITLKRPDTLYNAALTSLFT
jgi:hypothetical protein